ncbi:MAG: PepSY domain-containing protein [Gammaproteobacteria bacterium]|nr:PepSY domain-containing protein [Gammaproteobacteria bacterium]MDE2251700.1 PepSY domain-containing protein [Gammaproteobacteria bacterium]
MRAGQQWSWYARAALPGVVLCVVLAAATPVRAAFADPPQARSLAGAEGSSRDRIIDSVQKRYHARVLRVSETSVNGRPALELRLMSEQRVFNVVVDAASGQVLSGG